MKRTNPFTLEFTLKQHTPIIHFQHDQDGATLRATEVKPKLDAFLEKKSKELSLDFKHAEQKTPDGPTRSTSYNYKLQITAKEPVKELCGDIEKEYYDKNGRLRTLTFPTFFANMGDGEKNGKKGDEKKIFMFHENITVKISCFNTAFLNFIEKYIGEFFMTHNFGTRQSKGFGSFTVEGFNQIEGFRFFELDVSKFNWPGDKSDAPDENFLRVNRLFEIINLFYGTIRSGLNQYNRGNNGIYVKPVMFAYAKAKYNAQWDKKTLKQAFLGKDLKHEIDQYPNSDALGFNGEKLLLRDLLGLASNMQWKAKYDISLEKSHPYIKRMKSPITFKPIALNENLSSYKVYLIPDSINNYILGKTFSVKSSNTSHSINLTTPENFDIKDFINFLCNNVSIEELTKVKFGVSRDTPDSVILKNIYKNLKHS